MKREFCVNCGEGSKKTTTTIEVPYKEPYQGNMVVVLTRHSHPEHPKPWTEYTLWDTETYEPLPYGYFCRLKCCREFANDCAAAGYRRK